MSHCEDCGNEFAPFFPFVLAMKEAEIQFDILPPFSFKSANRDKKYAEVLKFTTEYEFFAFCLTAPLVSEIIVNALSYVDPVMLAQGCEFGFGYSLDGDHQEPDILKASRN